ncbi:MAG: aminopeptidase P family protein [Bacteroidota bacterium]
MNKSFLIFISILIVSSSNLCQKKIAPVFWKNNPQLVITQSEAQKEIEEKLVRVQSFLNEQKLDGLLLTQVRNFYWITAGLANNQIVLNKDVGAASLLILKDGKKYLLCTGSEAGRLMDESLGKLGYELKKFNWYEANPVKDVRGDIIKEISKGGKIGSDVNFPGTVLISDQFKKIRYSLLGSEIKRYRWLGKEVTEAVAEVCKSIKPGMNEYEIEALTSAALRARGILPTVLLIAVDNRIFKYRHALPNGATLDKYAMINVCAEKWGMPIAVTRFVYFGKLPGELKNKFEKTAKIFTQYELATVPGKAGADIFEQCKKWYEEAGFPDEWKKHHQGGATGYDDRDYVIYPGIDETILDNQAFAWNPTITGAKVEDTFIAYKDHFEVITKSDGWPMITVEINGKKYEQPGVLIR